MTPCNKKNILINMNLVPLNFYINASKFIEALDYSMQIVVSETFFGSSIFFLSLRQKLFETTNIEYYRD